MTTSLRIAAVRVKSLVAPDEGIEHDDELAHRGGEGQIS
ncbi:MAG: hypothetical protein K0R41_3967 [Geminicoccaceae bacterium]|nr:hypothetical protein [Geminicoccaceae bacterium]